MKTTADLPRTAFRGHRRPSFPLSVLADPVAREAFIDVLKCFLDKATAR